MTKEDLKVKIGTKDEAYWTQALNQAEELVTKGKNDLIINEAIVKLAKEKIAEEEAKV
jgi:hypothetical protein